MTGTLWSIPSTHARTLVANGTSVDGQSIACSRFGTFDTCKAIRGAPWCSWTRNYARLKRLLTSATTRSSRQRLQHEALRHSHGRTVSLPCHSMALARVCSLRALTPSTPLWHKRVSVYYRIAAYSLVVAACMSWTPCTWSEAGSRDSSRASRRSAPRLASRRRRRGL